MSRIGKKPIPIPQNVSVQLEENKLLVKGPKGELQLVLRPELKVTIKDNNICVERIEETKAARSFHGLYRTLIANMVIGVTEGFEKKLEIKGVGYRCSLDGNKLILNVGFSHPVEFIAPPGISFKVEKNIITINGIDKQLVGETAARIRKIRPPDPYKGKGICYLGEVIKLKPGKKGKVGVA